MMFLKVIGLSFLLCTAVVVLRAALPTDVQVRQGRPHPPVKTARGNEREREREGDGRREEKRGKRDCVERDRERERVWETERVIESVCVT
jgi:hypothetical protein